MLGAQRLETAAFVDGQGAAPARKELIAAARTVRFGRTRSGPDLHARS